MADQKKQPPTIDRRGFFKISSVLGLAGMGQLACGSNKSSEKVIYRRLGKTGIKIPVVSNEVNVAEAP
jgi:hypothetical protein